MVSELTATAECLKLYLAASANKGGSTNRTAQGRLRTENAIRTAVLTLSPECSTNNLNGENILTGHVTKPKDQCCAICYYPKQYGIGTTP